MNNKLKISSNYGTRYEELLDLAKTKKYFNELDWRYIMRGNTSYNVESYVDALTKAEGIRPDYMNKEYNFQYADGNTRLAALYNEIYANRNNVDTEREKYATNEYNAVILDENEKPVIEKYTASDYEYYKSLIKQQNDVNYENFLVEQDKERKDSMNWFVRDVLGNIAAVGGEYVYGLTKQIDDVVDMVGALVQSTGDSIINNTAWDDNFIKYLNDEDFRMFDELGENIIDFERRYTSLRTYDGEYSNFGKYLGGIATTLGQLTPTILLTLALNYAGTALGASASAVAGTASTVAKVATTAGQIISKAAPIVSQVVFYTGVTTSYIRETYKQFALEGCTVPSEQIIANTLLKVGLQVAIEVGLGKILGGTGLDNLAFGRSAKSVTGKTLFTRSLKRLSTDFAQEGLEEVLQDTSDFLVDEGFEHVINNNFGKLSENFSLQSLIDAFVIGGIASFAGNAARITFTSTKPVKGLTGTDNILLNKLAAWEYGFDLQSFVKNYNQVIKQVKNESKNVTINDKNKKAYTHAMTELYASYRMIASLYGEIGKERFEAANSVLTEITNAINDGVFDKVKMKEYAKNLYDSVYGENNLRVEYDNAELQKIEDAKLAEEVAKAVRGEEVTFTNIDEDNDLKNVMEEIMEQSSKVDSVIATKYGENVVMIGKTMIAPIEFLKNARALVANATVKEHELINDVIENASKKYGLNLNDVLDTYKKLTGDKKGTIEKALTVMILDKDLRLFRTMLVTANKDTYSFLSGLTTHINMLSMTDVADKIHKNTLVKIKNRMIQAVVDYLKVQPNADYQLSFLTKSQINSIKIERWANNVYSRVILGEDLSERDLNVLYSRIDNMTIRDDLKTELKNDILSVNADVRESAMKRIDGYYNNMYTTKYDGKTYMPMNSVPNMAFNNYLQGNGLTLQTWLSTNVDAELVKLITTIYGEFNNNTLLQYRIKMFSESVNNTYSVNINDGKVYIVNTSDGTRVGYSNYNSKINQIVKGENVDVTRSILNTIDNTKKLISITKSLLDTNINDTVANMININDIIYDSDLLNEKIKQDIITKYGNITPENTFMHLRTLLINTYKTISLVAKPDGSFAFVNVKPMDKMFKNKKVEISNKTKLSDIIKSEYLTGVLATTELVITNRNIAAEYVMYENEVVQNKPRRTFKNTIYIGKRTAESSPEYLKFAIAHEIQHVIQFENKLNLGLNENWINNIPSSVKIKIIADVKKHKPDLFTESMTKEQIEKVVSSFIYHTSGESAAMGLDTTELVDFYPTMVTYTDNDTVITMPWGTTYQLKQGIITFGINKVKVENNTIENALIKATKDYNVLNIIIKPETCFIMPDGKLRSTDGKNHLDIITSINKKIDTSYFDTIPQVNWDGDLYNIRISNNMSTETTETLVKIINAIYKSGREFTLERINYGTEIGQLITSDLAKDAQGILRAYTELNNFTKMSLIKIADNLWEVEGIKDLVEVNKEYADNVKPEFEYGENRDLSFSYSAVYDDFPSMERLFEISNYRNNEYLNSDDVLSTAQELRGFDYIYEQVVNEAINRKIIEEKYRNEILRVFEEGWENDIDVNVLDSLNKVDKIIANYVHNSYDFYNNYYSKNYNIVDKDVKNVFDAVYKYVIDFDLNDIDNIYDLLTSEPGKKFKNITLKKLYNDSIKDKSRLSYSDFLELDIPYFRFQFGDIKPSDFVSVSININNENSFIKYLNNTFAFGKRWATSNKFLVGKIKLKQILCYIDNGMNEVLLPTSELTDSKIYDITHSNDFKDNNMYLTKPVPSIISSKNILPRDRSINYEKELFYNIINNEVNYINYHNDVRSLVDKDEISPTEEYYIDNIFRSIKKFYKTGIINFNIKKQYLRTLYQLVLKHSDFKNKYSFYEDSDNVGFINNDTGELFISEFNTNVTITNTETGNIITDEQITSNTGPDEVRMSLAQTEDVVSEEKIKPKKVAEHKVKTTNDTDERYLKWKEAKGTNLEYFYKKGKKTQLHPELKKFVALTTDIPVDEELMEKINGKKAGTLTYKELREYFAFTDLDNMDNDTFDVFNKAVFKNKAIKSKTELQNYIDKSDKYFAAYLAYKTSNKSSKNLDLLYTEDKNVADSIVNVFDNKLTNKKLDLYGKLYSNLLQQYDKMIVLDERYLKILWMRYFNGSLDSASHAVNIARWVEKYNKNTSTKISADSMSTRDAADRTVGEKISDVSALEAFDAVLDEMSAKEKRDMISLELTKSIATIIVNKYGATEDARKTTMSTIVKAKEILAKLPNKALNSLVVQKIISEVLGTDFDTVLENDSINDFANKEVPVSYTIRGIKNRTRNISRRLITKWQKKKFLEKYSDYFNEDITIKEELYKNENGTYKTTSEIAKLKEIVEEASELVKSGVFTSSQNFRAFEQLQREMRKNIQQIKDLQEKLKNKTDTKIIKVLNINDYKIDVESSRDVPSALKEILDTEFKDVTESKTKYLTNDNDVHFKTNFKQFIEKNANNLASLTQDDVDEIVNYYVNSRTLETNVTGRLYNAIQIYMSTYLLRIDSINNFRLSESQREALTKTTEGLISTAAQELSNWKSAMAYLKPAEEIYNSLAKSCGIEIDEADIDNLIKALSTGKAEQIELAKQQMIENTTKKYRLQGRKINVLDRLLQFQRVAMLSSPSTWGRNMVSNVSITGLNAVSANIGKLLNNLLSKKHKIKYKNQYKIVGTKVDKNTSDFVKRTLLDTKLFDSINDTLSKYDPRSSDKNSIEHNLAKMITKKIGTDIFYNNYLDDKVSKLGKLGKFTKRNINGWYKFVYKALSDNIFVKKATLRYFSKMLVEDNVDLSKGLTNEIQSLLADAYVLAAADYMHKPNLLTKLEGTIKNHSPIAYFIYKQVFPFAGASWNWFWEGVNYTPVGLLLNITKFARLENTIEKLDKAREKGDTAPNSRFAQYIVSRDIGKGVIGSVGTLLGIMLASLGFVRLDEEDDKYKLYCNGTYVDISDLFGTQGIFLGISIAQGIIDGYEDFTNDDGSINFNKIVSIIGQGFNVFFMDSIYADFWNTVRFNGSNLGEYFTNLPFSMLQTYIPNWYKTMMSIFYPYDIQYSSGIQGKVERLGATIVPWAFPKQVDVYTGEYQLAYKGGPFVNDLINAYNKAAPIKLYPYNVTKNEEEAVLLGIHKGMLTGKYKIDGKEIKLTSDEVVMLNQYYGQLNKTELDLLYSDSTLYEVENDKGQQVKLRYSKMNDKQKTTVIKRIMSNNSSYAKVYILTNKGYLYYASESEFAILKKLGIENVYKKTKTKQGFVKP